MKVKVKSNNQIIDVKPYYLNGRIVCYVEQTQFGNVSWLTNEVDVVIDKEYYGN